MGKDDWGGMDVWEKMIDGVIEEDIPK